MLLNADGRRLPFFLLLVALLTLYTLYTIFPNSLKSVVFNSNRSEETLSNTEVMGKVDDLTCRLPRLDAFLGVDNDFLQSDRVICEGKRWKKIFGTDLDSNLVVLREPEEVGWFNCCYKAFPPMILDDCVPLIANFTPISGEVKLISIFCSDEKDSEPQNLVDMLLLLRFEGESKVKGQHHEDILNVILLGLDSVSHMNLIRHMPLTYDYLKTNLSAIEMESYINVASETFPNLVPILSGQSVDQLKDKCWPTTGSTFDECHFIWSDFAAKGYVTSFLEDIVRQGVFEYDKKGFGKKPTFDYARDLIDLMDRKMGHSGVNGFPFCFGPRLGLEILLDYAMKFTNQMTKLGQPYFQLLWATAGFHERLDFPSSADEVLLEALKWFEGQGHLTRTALIFVSDHGQRYGKFRQTKQGGLEMKMPFLFFILPKWFIEKYPQAITNLRINRQRLSSPFDLHETLRDLLDHEKRLVYPDGNSKGKGRSHFSRIPWNRHCEDAGIDSTWCICDQDGAAFQPLPLNHQLAKAGSKVVLDQINSIVSASRQCAKLHLSQVLSADVLLKMDSFQKSDDIISKIQKLLIMIETLPGNGVFEATLLVENGTDWSFFGEINRVNSYGGQSSCVQAFLRNYCFCFDH